MGMAVVTRGSGRSATAERDRALLRRIAAQDAGALEELYDVYAGACHALAYRVVSDAVLAQDVVQEVFLAAWSGASRYDPQKAAVSTYLLSMTHHKAVDLVRREQTQRRRRAPVDAAEEVPDGTDLESEVWTMLEGERVRSALDGLPDAQREALQLAYYDGYTQREIAGLVGVPLGTVKTRMLAGMRKLAGVLGGRDAPALGKEGPA